MFFGCYLETKIWFHVIDEAPMFQKVILFPKELASFGVFVMSKKYYFSWATSDKDFTGCEVIRVFRMADVDTLEMMEEHLTQGLVGQRLFNLFVWYIIIAVVLRIVHIYRIHLTSSIKRVHHSGIIVEKAFIWEVFLVVNGEEVLYGQCFTCGFLNSSDHNIIRYVINEMIVNGPLQCYMRDEVGPLKVLIVFISANLTIVVKEINVEIILALL